MKLEPIFNRTSFKPKPTMLSYAMFICIVNMPVQAMQVLDDESMSDVTGEGIAFSINTANMQFNSADDAGVGNANTGYIRFIPRGALSTTITNHNTAVAAGCGGVSPPGGCTAAQIAEASKYNVQIGKGDIYLYGLAFSANDNNANTLRSTGDIDIGNSVNPMLIKVVTQPAVPNFVGAGTEDLSYMAFEYPLYQASWSGATFNDTTSKNLKLGMWADAYVRDATIAEGNAAQFQLNGATRNTSTTNTAQIIRENRLRLQMVLNGFSLDGSNLKIFQTQTGATNANGLSTSYNDTLGLAGVVRINTGDSRGLKATVTDITTPTTGAVGAWTTIHGGGNTTLDPSTTNPTNGTGNCNNGGGGQDYNESQIGCRYFIQNRTRADTKSRTRAWTIPSLDGKVFRLSTRETTDTDLMNTPALNNTLFPNFASNEGLYMYNPNINLIYGSIWQPVILGVAPDNRNLVMEVTRIVNKPEVYKEIYTAYSGAQGGMSNADFASLNGSTCNIYQCGGTTANGYQTSNNAYFYNNNNGTVSKLNIKNATHSSISVGTVNYDQANNLLTAYNGEDAIGVSFGALSSNVLTANTSSGTLYEVRYKQRQENTQTWRSASRCTGSVLGNCTSTTEQTGFLYQWEYNTGAGYSIGSVAVPLPGNVAICSTAAFNGNTTCSNVTPATTVDGISYPACPNNASCNRFGTTSNRNWANQAGAAWLQGAVAADQVAFNNFIGSVNGTMASSSNLDTLPNQASTPIVGVPTPLNNLGSAVIDGLLVQHLKITTKGL